MSIRNVTAVCFLILMNLVWSSVYAQSNSSQSRAHLKAKPVARQTSVQKIPVKQLENPSHLQVLIYPLSPGFYSERGEGQEQKLRKPENFALGLRYGRWSSYIESSQFEEITGQGNYTVERKRKSFLLWNNYDVAEFENLVYLPVGLGLGVYNETSITKLPGLQDRSGGDYQWNAGLSAALELRYRFMSFKTEGQLLFANNQTPNPTWAAFVRLGVILF